MNGMRVRLSFTSFFAPTTLIIVGLLFLVLKESVDNGFGNLAWILIITGLLLQAVSVFGRRRM